MLEDVRRRVAGMIKDLEIKLYEEQLGTFSLEKKRLRGIMIDIFKYLKVCSVEDGTGVWFFFLQL